MRQRGFTLIELLMVTAIIGVVSSGFILAISDDRANEVELREASVSEIVRAVRYARDESIRTAVPHGVRFEIYPEGDAEIPISVFRVEGSAEVPAMIQLAGIDHPLWGTPYEIRPCCKLKTVSTWPTVEPLNVAFGSDGVPLQLPSLSPYARLDECQKMGVAIAIGTQVGQEPADWIVVDPVTGRVSVYLHHETLEWCSA